MLAWKIPRCELQESQICSAHGGRFSFELGQRAESAAELNELLAGIRRAYPSAISGTVNH
jgi:hypothetical protein